MLFFYVNYNYELKLLKKLLKKVKLLIINIKVKYL